ncbi:preprotein translocase subunit SecG [Megalodesulfovibrio gigas]|uniref:Protein-export membrane protein SecG n=1 Tax=Megalodesulfovibrio gigas (strain ATCC 19364 / DSM 1382 / NCIMB 9332 / VKM B-1759) TaxID=1121448 RepID=T2G8N2_MEGG1|nr:preprotein translocase subunit SecG [Megalodesulfovibrio gigas]AGW12257.1 putative preprotein translocase subunit SecG [Megalodesulfovibrio gigas DSM 1382 = ATCC 19364]
METLVLTLHIIACLVLIVLVLLQSGKEGMGVIFGGGSSSLFGGSGAGGLLVKITAMAAAIFLTTSLGYNYLNKSGRNDDGSVMDAAIVSTQGAPENATMPPAGLLIEEKGAAPDFSVKESSEAAAPAPMPPAAASNQTQ